jgi:hypothetical protein
MPDPDERPVRDAAGSPIAPLRSGGFPREVVVPLVLLAIAFLIAVVQPWAGSTTTELGAVRSPAGSASASRASAGSPTAEPPTPTPSPDLAYAELVDTCGYPSGWRVATVQRWIGRSDPIPTWSAVDPVPASDATDPAIPYLPSATDLVLAIGYCSPVDDSRPPDAVEVEIWAVPEDGPPVQVEDMQRLEPPHANPLGGLWLPTGDVTATVDGATGWAPGRYAIRLVAPSFDRWLGVEIEDISGLRRSPVPGTSPSASPGAGPPSPSPSP